MVIYSKEEWVKQKSKQKLLGEEIEKLDLENIEFNRVGDGSFPEGDRIHKAIFKKGVQIGKPILDLKEGIDRLKKYTESKAQNQYLNDTLQSIAENMGMPLEILKVPIDIEYSKYQKKMIRRYKFKRFLINIYEIIIKKFWTSLILALIAKTDNAR